MSKAKDSKDVQAKKGAFTMHSSAFLDRVTADGSSGFEAEAGRYHLYVSLACPFAHRTLIARALKGLEKAITVTVLDWLKGAEGWKFAANDPDPFNNLKFLSELYQLVSPGYTGRITVPVLWDKQKKTIVSNDSADILRMLGTEFNAFCETKTQKELDFYPKELRESIDSINEWVYNDVNIGVYKSGFATTQEAYDEAVRNLFAGLDKIEEILSKSRYFTGDRFTEADIRLFTTLLRFDPVYVVHFKCDKKRIVDYPNIWPYTREIYQMSGITSTIDMEYIRKHYFASHTHVNPHGIVSVGPDLDFMQPHGRDKKA